MTSIEVFIVAFVVSFVGSIPPGTINISVMQLAMQNQRKAALYLALAATLVEFGYSSLAVQFQQFLAGSDQLSFYFQVLTGTVLIALGLANLLSNAKSERFLAHGPMRRRIGFARGLILGLLNPLTIPFWLVVTAYLESHHWIEIGGYNFWIYIFGLSSGTFVLLALVDLLGSKFKKVADNSIVVHRIPGIVLISMGIYNIWNLL